MPYTSVPEMQLIFSIVQPKMDMRSPLPLKMCLFFDITSFEPEQWGSCRLQITEVSDITASHKHFKPVTVASHRHAYVVSETVWHFDEHGMYILH